MCASVHRNAPMNFSAQGVLSFYWIPSYAITPQRLTCREVGSGVVWNLGSSQALGSQGWRLGFCLHCLIFPVILAQSFLISDARDLLRPSVGLCCSTVWFYFPIFYSRSDPLMFLLIKAFFFLSPFLFLFDDWLPWGHWQLAVFTSGKMHFILLCLSSALVTQDTTALRRLLSEAAISPACGLICLLSPQPSLYICPLTGT